jgi:hypothetical protein
MQARRQGSLEEFSDCTEGVSNSPQGSDSSEVDSQSTIKQSPAHDSMILAQSFFTPPNPFMNSSMLPPNVSTTSDLSTNLGQFIQPSNQLFNPPGVSISNNRSRRVTQVTMPALAIDIPPSDPDLYLSGSPATPSTSGSSITSSSSLSTPPITAPLPITGIIRNPSTSLSTASQSPPSATSSALHIPSISTPSLPNVFEGVKVSRPYSSNPVPIGFGGVSGDWATDEVKDQLVREERRRRVSCFSILDSVGFLHFFRGQNKESSQKHRDRAKEKRREQDQKMEYLENRVLELEKDNDQLREALAQARMEVSHSRNILVYNSLTIDLFRFKGFNKWVYCPEWISLNNSIISHNNHKCFKSNETFRILIQITFQTVDTTKLIIFIWESNKLWTLPTFSLSFRILIKFSGTFWKSLKTFLF